MRAAKLALAVMASLAVAFAISSCGAPKKTLRVYNWIDYIDPAIVKQFERESGCKVKMDFFESNESMLTRLDAGCRYDVLVPSTYYADIMNRRKMLRPLDKSKLPNLANIDPEYIKKAVDPRMDYCAPYMIGFMGIGYDKTKVKDFKPSWRMFEDNAIKGRCVLLNDPREVIGAALRALGFSLNTVKQEEVDKAVKLVVEWRKNIAGFDVDEAKLALASGELWLIQNYNGDTLQAKEDNKNIEFVIPEEGGSVSIDTMVVSAAAAEPELAHAFINFVHRPDIAARNMLFTKYPCPNVPAVKLLPAEFRSNTAVFPTPEIWAKCEIIRDLGNANDMYTKAWDALKSAEVR